MDKEKCTPIFYAVNLKQDAWARVFINDIPLYKGAYVGPDSRTGAFNHLLVPGENEITIELLQAKSDEGANVDKKLASADRFELQIYEVTNPDAGEFEPIERRIILDVRYPSMLETQPERFRRLPFYYRAKFDPGVEVREPPWLRSPPEDFGCDGTPELHDAVRRIFGALEQKNWDAFLGEMSFKLATGQYCYWGIETHDAAYKRDLFKTELFPFEPELEPVPLSELHFQSRRNGSVAYVTKKDGDFPMVAFCKKDPRRRIRADLLFTKDHGRWRAFA